MITVEYRDLPLNEIDKLKPLWEKLKSHHFETATVFKTDFARMTFTERKLSIKNKDLKILIAQEKTASRIVGYCISSISEERLGEVDSLYIEEEFRRSGIGREFMNRSLEWFNKKRVKNLVISVAVGNEAALDFYDKFGFAPRSYVLRKKPVKKL